MDIKINDFILAIVTLDDTLINGGGCPVFIAANEEQQQKIGLYLSKILGGVVHDLENGVFLICGH
ncbi:MAG: hypothetical protein GX581_04880 [Syntrophomonadaceae bacterium]|jgi:hypothetical protein|nr:hypothetical protein [Syntrophomonadaceae bacterium]